MAGDLLFEEQLQHLRTALLTWFDQHKRDLPWRRTRDPYAIWVSEVMLQQTRVAAVLEHYARWMERFPSVAALASAEEQEVLALWSGLGYYRRARFLHAGVRAVIAEHQGEVPRTAAELRRLPGIGEYTSAAIASIAFSEPIAVVDGNVERVLMRLAGLSIQQQASAPVSRGFVTGASADTAGHRPVSEQLPQPLPAASLARTIRSLANHLLTPERPGDFNQAMMELGATVCLPRAPLCLHCPVQPWCATRGEHVTAPKKAMQSRVIDYALITRTQRGQQQVLLVQRPLDASLMAGMWELPELAPSESERKALLTLRHAITVTNYTVQIQQCAQPESLALQGRPTAAWHPVAQLPEIALTGLARKVLKWLALWPEGIAAG